MIAQVWPPRHRLGKMDDQAAAEQQPEANRRDDEARRYRADRCAARAERRHRPEARDQDDVERDVQHRHQDPEAQGCARITGRSQRPAEHEEKQHADAEDEHRPQERQRLAFDLGRRVHQIEEGRRQHVAERREDDERQDERGQERLVNRPVDLFWLVRAGEPRDEHAHPREERGDEDDDDEEDLPADADGGVAGKPDVVADHHVVDDALQTTDRILEDGRPRQLPNRRRDWALDERPIELARGGRPRWRGRGLGRRAGSHVRHRSSCRFSGRRCRGRWSRGGHEQTMIPVQPAWPGIARMSLSTRLTSACASTTAGWRCRASK